MASGVKSEKDKCAITYMLHLRKKGTNELIYKTEIVTDVENKFMVTKYKFMVTKGERGR